MIKYGNDLDDISDPESRIEYFRALVAEDTEECEKQISTGEIVCYQIACRWPEMLVYMPDIVKRRLTGYYSVHMKKCFECSARFLIYDKDTDTESVVM